MTDEVRRDGKDGKETDSFDWFTPFVFPVKISRITLYGFTHQKPEVMKVERGAEEREGDKAKEKWRGFCQSSVMMYEQTQENGKKKTSTIWITTKISD